MELGLNGKKALITGGERGIGKDICLALARDGVDIAYCDIKIESGHGSTQHQVSDLGQKAIAMEVDVSVEEQVIQFVQTAINELGCIGAGHQDHAGMLEPDPGGKSDRCHALRT